MKGRRNTERNPGAVLRRPEKRRLLEVVKRPRAVLRPAGAEGPAVVEDLLLLLERLLVVFAALVQERVVHLRPLERARIFVSPDDGQIVVDKSQKFQSELGQWDDPSSFIPAA